MTSTPPNRDDDGSVDVEAAWADIIARWDEEQPPVGRWPAVEDTDDDPDEPPDDAPADRVQIAEIEGWGTPGSHVGGEATRAAASQEPDDEEGYVPPEPPPLPRGDLVTNLAWAGVLGAPLFFVFTALFWRTVPQVLIVVAIAAFVAGFVTLVIRMPDRRDDDDDDGAVV